LLRLRLIMCLDRRVERVLCPFDLVPVTKVTV